MQTKRQPRVFFIGGIDDRFYNGPIYMVPVVREHYWEVKLDALFVGEKQFCCLDNNGNYVDSYVIFDSGTSFNTMPSTEIEGLFEAVEPKSCGDMTKTDLNNEFPTIRYVLSGISIPLTPEMYLLEGNDGDCKPAYMQINIPSEFGHAYIMGSAAFMKHYVTVFRRGTNGKQSMVGMAKSQHTKAGVDFLNSLKETKYQ